MYRLVQADKFLRTSIILFSLVEAIHEFYVVNISAIKLLNALGFYLGCMIIHYVILW